MSTPAEVRKFKLPLTPIECAGCQMCSFQRGHAIAYKDVNSEMVGYFDLVGMVEQADARIAALEVALHTAAHLLGDMHDNSPACLFNGAKGEDVGCLACLAQMQIEKEMERQ